MLRAHDQLRAVLNHRMNTGTMSLQLLHRKTGIGCSHLSNFRLGRRALSIHAMADIAHALGFQAELVPLADPVQVRTPRDARLPVAR